MTEWPTQLSYQEVLSFPQYCFTDPELAASHVADTAFGLPLPRTGHTANVYRLQHGSDTKSWAVRLFLRPNPIRDRRYQALMALATLPNCMVQTEWQPTGLMLSTGSYPLVKQDWVSGVPINTYIEQNLGNPAALRALADRWAETMVELLRAQLAHGDLQHGNILIEPEGRVRLIDYDALYLPTLSNEPSGELGHPSYQHPARTAADYGLLMDRFPALVVFVALHAVAAAPEVWYRLDNGDNLLFRREDLAAPSTSRAFSVLSECLRGQRDTLTLVEILRESCTRPLALVPPLSRLR